MGLEDAIEYVDLDYNDIMVLYHDGSFKRTEVLKVVEQNVKEANCMLFDLVKSKPNFAKGIHMISESTSVPLILIANKCCQPRYSPDLSHVADIVIQLSVKLIKHRKKGLVTFEI